jgi:acyl carrier protein phosphodiesterase
VNWLAHLFLAEDSPHAWIGNLVGDFAHGLDPETLHPLVRAGLEHHRAIDRFTDTHPLHRASRARFAERFRHFAGVLVDLTYDHFLARSWSLWSAEPLEDFAARVHRVLAEHPELLSPELREAAPHLERRQWLLSYRDGEGLARVLRGIESRTRRGIDLVSALEVLEDQRAALQAEFDAFFPALVAAQRRFLTP